MRIETIFEEGDTVFVPQEAADDSWDSDAMAGVATVIADVDDDGEIDVTPIEGGDSFYVKADAVKPWAEDDPDHARVFILDLEGLEALPIGARVCFGRIRSRLVTEHTQWSGNWGPYELLNPEILDAPTFDFPLEIVGPDNNGHAFAEGTRVRVVEEVYGEFGRHGGLYLVTTRSDVESPEWDYKTTRNVDGDSLATAEDAYAPLVKVFTPPAPLPFQVGDRVRVLKATYAEEVHGEIGTVVGHEDWKPYGTDGPLHRYLVKLGDGQYGRSPLHVAELEHVADDYASGGETEGPVFVLDAETARSLPVGSLIRILRDRDDVYDLRFRTKRGWVRGDGAGDMSMTPNMARIIGAEVLHLPAV